MLSLYTHLKALQGQVMNEDGATMVEYGVIVALIAALAILVITALGVDVLGAFNTVEDGIGGSQA